MLVGAVTGCDGVHEAADSVPEKGSLKMVINKQNKTNTMTPLLTPREARSDDMMNEGPRKKQGVYSAPRLHIIIVHNDCRSNGRQMERKGSNEGKRVSE